MSKRNAALAAGGGVAGSVATELAAAHWLTPGSAVTITAMVVSGTIAAIWLILKMRATGERVTFQWFPPRLEIGGPAADADAAEEQGPGR